MSRIAVAGVDARDLLQAVAQEGDVAPLPGIAIVHGASYDHRWEIVMPLCRALVAVGLLLVLAAPGRADAAIVVSVAQPTVGLAVSGDLPVRVTVASTLDIDTVTARVGSTDFPLSYSCSPSCGWRSTIELEALGLPLGDTLLRVTAVDVFAGTTEVTRTFVYAPPPRIDVFEPTSWSVARPRIRVRASCEDAIPGPCTSFTLSASGDGFPYRMLLSTTQEMDAEVDLGTTDEDRSIELNFRAVGASGIATYVTRSINVESNANLEEVERVPGVIKAADETRILYLDELGTVRIRDRVSDADTPIFVLYDPDAIDPIFGVPILEVAELTPYGALLSIWNSRKVPQCGDAFACLFEWRDDGIEKLGDNVYGALAQQGNWAIWSDEHTLWLRDLAAATTQVVSSSTLVSPESVTANGDVVYADANGIMRLRAAAVETIVAESGYSRPGTDGISVVYQHRTASSPSYLYEILLHTPAGTETVSGPSLGEPDYRIRDGWVAFTRLSNAGQPQVWLRDPVGSITRKSFFGPSTGIQSLGPGGQLSFVTANRHYLVPSDAPANFIGIGIGTKHSHSNTPLHTAVLADGLHVYLGGSLFRVTALEDPDADGVANYSDNCRDDLNPEQIDADQDGVGEPCGCAWVGPEVLTCDAFVHGTLAIADESRDETSVWIRSAGCDARGACAAPGVPAHGTLVTGGLVGGWLAVMDDSDLALHGGTVEGSVAALGTATATIFDGEIVGGLVTREEASIRWEGGAVGGALVAYDDSLIEVIGDSFEVDGVSAVLGDLSAQTGVLTGRLASGELFSVSFFQGGASGTPTTGTIRLVPEPHAALLAAVAWLALAARQRVRRSRCIA